MRMKRKVLLVIFLLAPVFFPPVLKYSAAAPPGCENGWIVKNIVIKVKGKTSARSEKLAGMARRIIRLAQGECFSDDALAGSIELLKQTGQFSRIHIPDINRKKTGTDVVFILTPAPLIRQISVSGAFPVFRSEVVRRTDFKVGSPFFPKQVKAAVQSIKTLMKEQGYINPGVEVHPRENGDGTVSLDIKIDKKEFFEIGKVEIIGNKRFSDTRLALGMKTPGFQALPGSFRRFVKSELETDLETLTRFYRKKGFAEVTIRHEVEKNPEDRQVKILFHIDEGPEYRIGFTGNTEFFDFTLKKDLVLKQKGNLNGFGIKQSLKNIKARYRNAGYPDAEITHKTDTVMKNNLPVRKVTFHIRENRKHLVRSVGFEGIESFSAEMLEKEVLTSEKELLAKGAFVRETLENDCSALENFYRMKGFENTSVNTKVQWTPDSEKKLRYADVVFRINEGTRRLVSSVEIRGVGPDYAETLAENLSTRKGEPCVKSDVKQDRRKILSILAEEGYLYSMVDPQIRTGEDGKTCTVIFSIEKNRPVRIGGTWIFGTFKTENSVLRQPEKLNTGAPVSLADFSEFKKNIRNTECIKGSDFRVVGIENRLDELFFITQVEEIRPYFIESSLGYDTVRDAYVSVVAGDRNFLGKNREFSVDAAWSGIGYDTGIELKGHDLFNVDIETRLRVATAKEEEKNQTFGIRSSRALFSLQREFRETLTSGASFKLESREQYRIQEHTKLQFEETRTIFTLSPFVNINRTDSFVKPENGYFAGISADYSKDVSRDLDDFIRYNARVKYYKKVAPGLVLAFQGMYGQIVNLAEESRLPDDQLFYLGGVSSVRGYKENMLFSDASDDPVGGKQMVSGSMEARIDLGMNFELPVFIDAGTLMDVRGDDISEQMKWTAGAGIRYMTPIGPIGLLYGHKLNREPDEAAGRFHFSIGYTF